MFTENAACPLACYVSANALGTVDAVTKEIVDNPSTHGREKMQMLACEAGGGCLGGG
jgi:hypothetical protein